MSDLENTDVMLGDHPSGNFELQVEYDDEGDLRSNRQNQEVLLNDEAFRSYLNTNISENSGLTMETNRAINSEISSQMSRKLEELKSD